MTPHCSLGGGGEKGEHPVARRGDGTGGTVSLHTDEGAGSGWKDAEVLV